MGIRFIRLLGVLLAVALLQAPAVAEKPASAPCDRACLESLVTTYLDAMIARDVKRLPVARTVRYAENHQQLKLGEGSWLTIDGLGTYRHIFADTGTGNVGAIATVREHGVGALFDLRLKIEDRRITEIETFLIRDPGGYARYEAMGAPEAVWLETVPAAERRPRAQLIAAANSYFQGMQHNDGRGDYSFFHPECDRLEHALKTTNLKRKEAYGHSTDIEFSSMTCEEQFKTGFLGFVTELRNRRFLMVDEERQVVFAFVTLDHNGTIRELNQTTGKVFVLPPYFSVPRTLQANEAFKLKDGKLYRIEMTLTELPYGIRPPWSDTDPAPVPAAKTPASGVGCDRACLDRLADQFVQALLANDGSRLPLAEGFRYTENGQPLKVGDALWGTLSAYAGQDPALAPAAADLRYKVDIFDPGRGEIVRLLATDENRTKGVLVLRLRAAGDKIAEAEALVVREEFSGARAGTVTLFQPRLLVTMDGAKVGAPDPLFAGADPVPADAMIAAANAYFDGIEKGSAKKIPLASDCVRRDNGVQTSGNPDAPPLDPAQPAYKPFALGCAEQIDSGLFSHVGSVRDRRFIADPDRGLLLAFAMVDTPGTTLSFKAPGVGTIAYPGPRPQGAQHAGVQFTSDLAAPNLISPSTAESAMLFKFVGGRIARIDSFARAGPYGFGSGWPSR